MPVPRVAIVGRPNVGKSSLLNMLAGRKVSIVDPTPGVTRDRVSALVELTAADGDRTRLVEFTDTGGYGVYVAEGGRFDEVGNDLSSLTDDVEFQIAEAVAGADMVLFCVDAQAGITSQDLEIARLLREQRLGQARRGATGPDAKPRQVPVRVVATKVDGPKWETHAVEIAGLGFDEPLMCSAMNNYLRRTLVETLFDIVPRVEDERGEARADLNIAIIGRRNAGKSTLVNTLAGAPRVIVSEIPGTTRDAVDVRFERDGQSILAIDTAGLRRKKSFQGAIEHYAFDRMKRAVDRADVVLLMVDATERASQVDEQLAWLVQRSYKPVILVLNKWDLAEGRKNPRGKTVGPADFEEYLRKEFKGLSFAPIAIMSAETGLNVDETIDLAFDLQRQARSRVSTGELNRVLRAIIERQGPTSGSGVHTRIYYAAQIRCEPPTIVLIVNHPALFKPNYMRFLENRLREIVPFSEVPFRLVVRAKRRDETQEPDSGREGGVSVGQAAAAAKLERRKGRGGVGVGGMDADALLNDTGEQLATSGAGGGATGQGTRASGKPGTPTKPAKGAPGEAAVTDDGFVMEGLSQEELDEILSQDVTEADAYFEDEPDDSERKPEEP